MKIYLFLNYNYNIDHTIDHNTETKESFHTVVTHNRNYSTNGYHFSFIATTTTTTISLLPLLL